ncbi:MAG: TonB-dependent receptor plug domain-containing protein [Bacteroidetes bacterium]|nr:TonB-dependent receptor plug domain-containing protein [Bacteroidota bacterium]MCW5894823.1 TonB-dependent receptor plug domain-containing protein [Bacteroidota bacterium]
MKHLLLPLFLTVLLIISTRAQTAEVPDTASTSYELPQVDVIGRKPGLLDRVPGSANIITPANLRRLAPINGNEILRTITGLHAVDEEGVGLRLNLGVRGLNPDRSRNLLMLEDGVPIALAPYGEPEMYYTPSIDRMARLEVLKGSGSILFGPQTIGGVINYITADPPAEPSGSLNTRIGNDGFFTTLLKYGTTSGNVGAQINLLRRQADNLVTTRFRISDLSTKLKFILGEQSVLGVKLSAYDESSNSTYVGLTQTMYDNGDYFTNVAPDDELNIRRYSANATYDYVFAPGISLRTTVFGYTTTRNWRRQEFGRTGTTTNRTGVVHGDTTVPGGALYMRNQTGNRNRQFEVAGIEPRFSMTHQLAGVRNELDLGFRFLYERAFEQLVLGTTFNSSSGNVRDDEIRTGYARSAFVQNRTYITDRLVVSPGIRLESFSYDRHIMRGQFSGAVRDTNLVAGNNLVQLIPGLGISYQISEGSSVFAGVHRGFAPPRVKDAVTSAGEALNLNAELSWNYELGTRLTPSEGVAIELTGFFLDFSNQIIPVSQSSGGTGTGLVNGGRSKHIGAEAGFTIDAGRLLDSDYSVIFNTNATYVRATFSADRFLTQSGTQVNVKGNSLPYAPKWFVSTSLAFVAPFGGSIQLTGNFVDKQFSDEFNTVAASANGLTGVIPAHFLFDISARYGIEALNSAFSLSIKNLFDKRYMASRRPEGIKVGLPRFVTAGLEIGL